MSTFPPDRPTAARRRRPAAQRPRAAVLALAALAGVVWPGPPAPLAAQETPPEVARARALEEGERPGEAADTLLAYLRRHPDDGGVRWWTAQLLRRAGRDEAAAEQYGLALPLSPADPWLRLEYADLLVSLERFGEARSVALPVADAGGAPEEARVRALTLLGHLAWWRGDLATAVERFEAALALAPDHREASDPLGQVRATLRPWVRVALEGLDDNQPYRRGVAEVEAGAFVTPLWSVRVRATPQALDPAPPAGSAPDPGVRTTGEVVAGVRGHLPAARLDVSVAGGGVLRAGSSGWVGHAALGVRLPAGLRVRGRAGRERYLWTLAAADTLVMVEAVELALDRADHPGWAGEAVVRRESFPDGNPVRTAYAWLLAPVVRGFRAGAAFSWQDSDETRWDPGLERFVRYFTPEEQRVASVLAEATLPLGPATARVNGSWGAWARERAPVSAGPGVPGPEVVFFERSYTPWSVGLAVDVPAGGDVTVRAEAERRETAFYELNRAALAVTVPLGGAR